MKLRLTHIFAAVLVLSIVAAAYIAIYEHPRRQRQQEEIRQYIETVLTALNVPADRLYCDYSSQERINQIRRWAKHKRQAEFWFPPTTAPASTSPAGDEAASDDSEAGWSERETDNGPSPEPSPKDPSLAPTEEFEDFGVSHNGNNVWANMACLAAEELFTQEDAALAHSGFPDLYWDSSLSWEKVADYLRRHPEIVTDRLRPRLYRLCLSSDLELRAAACRALYASGDRSPRLAEEFESMRHAAEADWGVPLPIGMRPADMSAMFKGLGLAEPPASEPATQPEAPFFAESSPADKSLPPGALYKLEDAACELDILAADGQRLYAHDRTAHRLVVFDLKARKTIPSPLSAKQEFASHAVWLDKPDAAGKPAGRIATFRQKAPPGAPSPVPSVELWDLDGGKLDDLEAAGATEETMKLAFRPDGQVLAGWSSERLRMWRTGSREVLLSVPRRDRQDLGQAVFLRNQMLLCIHKESDLDVREPICAGSGGTLLHVSDTGDLEWLNPMVKADRIAVSPGLTRLATESEGEGSYVWKVHLGSSPEERSQFRPVRRIGASNIVGWLDDDTLIVQVSDGQDGFFSLVDARSGKALGRLKAPFKEAYSCYHAGDVLFVSHYGKIITWDKPAISAWCRKPHASPLP